MRCDLHVHSRHSGSANVPLLPGWLECYSEPEAVYETARRRGMDIVTLTDHDSVTGALLLRERRPGTFVSEEVTVLLGGGRELHFGVYGIDERQHEEITRRRTDGERLVAYLAANDIPFAVNHLFSPLTGRRVTADLDWALSIASLLETGNAMLPAISNALADDARRRIHAGAVGGSDSHALRFVARSYTVVPGARSITEFLDGLRAGKCHAEGTASNGIGLTRDVLDVALAGARSGIRSARGAQKALLATVLLASAPLWVPAIGAAVGWSRLREHTMPRVYALGMARAAQRRRLGIA